MDHLRPGMILEFALKLKSGVLVARDPLFVRGKKIPTKNRRIEIYKPRRPLEPGQIAKDRAQAGDPQLVYRVTGKKDNFVESISTPKATSSAGTLRNGVDGAKIKKAFLGKKGNRLDRRGITSRTASSAYLHESIATPDLARHNEKLGYVRDRPAIIRMLVNARTPDHREVVRDTLKKYVPMIRRPRGKA